jgi:hypothetical protein
VIKEALVVAPERSYRPTLPVVALLELLTTYRAEPDTAVPSGWESPEIIAPPPPPPIFQASISPSSKPDTNTFDPAKVMYAG